MQQYMVDAFADKLFTGNQAAICVMDRWPSDGLMQKIAAENNFSETAFTVKNGDHYDLRWFTPATEIDLCGHGTLGTAFVLFNYYEQSATELNFETKSGQLSVKRVDDLFQLNFPSYQLKEVPVTEMMTRAFGAKPQKAYLARDLLAVFDDPAIVTQMRPDYGLLQKLDGAAQSVTAPGHDFDCISRVFAPKLGMEEDPVTGSTHCMIGPYWGQQLHTDHLSAYQASKRGGKLDLTLQGKRVLIAGPAVLYATCDILPDGF